MGRGVNKQANSFNEQPFLCLPQHGACNALGFDAAAFKCPLPKQRSGCERTPLTFIARPPIPLGQSPLLPTVMVSGLEMLVAEAGPFGTQRDALYDCVLLRPARRFAFRSAPSSSSSHSSVPPCFQNAPLLSLHGLYFSAMGTAPQYTRSIQAFPGDRRDFP